MILRLVTVALCAAASLLLPAGAGAQGFGPATDLTVPAPPDSYSCGNRDCTRPSAYGIRIAANAGGDTVATWLAIVPAGPGEVEDSYVVQAAYRPAGGAFGAAQTLGRFAWRSWDPSVPQVGIADDGRAFLTWDGWEAGSGQQSVHVAQTSPDGTFGQPRALERAGGTPDPVLAVGPTGHAVVAFESEERDQDGQFQSLIRVSTRDPGGDFGAPTTVGRVASSPRVRVGRGGAVLVVWNSIASVRGSMRPAAGGAFGAPQDLGVPAESSGWMDMAVAPDGRAAIVWREGEWETPALRARFLTSEGAPEGPAAPLPAKDLIPYTSVRVAFDAAGTAVAAWNECPDDGTSSRLCHFAAAEAAPHGAFGSREPIAGQVSYPGFMLALVSGSNGHIVLINGDFDAAGVQVARRISGATFEELSPVPHAAGTVHDPQLAVDGDGNPIVAWQLETPDELSSVQVTAGDWAPPSLSAEVPAAAQTGQPVSMRASAADPAGATVTWDLGDGTTMTGPEIDHAYAVAGRYTVTVTATDGLGNARSVTREIAVAAPAPAPVPQSQGGDRGGTPEGPPAAPVAGPPKPSTHARVSARFSRRGSRTAIRRLAVTHMAAGAAVEIRCSGRSCPITVNRWASTPSGWRNAKRALGKRTKLRAGTVIELRITAPGLTGQLVRYTLRRGRRPAVSLATL